MGIAASSALREEPATNGPAYGSLEGLGAPRKLKKKPVLVLDPEELAKAHMLFHEASAELVGEDVERAPKPATILGLAPMEEDDPEELGASDEVAEGDDSEGPSAEAVLSLTRSRNAVAPSFDDVEDTGDYGDLAADDGLDTLDDGLDLDNRIFPSLPLRPELAEDFDAGDEDDPMATVPETASATADDLAEPEDNVPVVAPDVSEAVHAHRDEEATGPVPLETPVQQPQPAPPISALDAIRAQVPKPAASKATESKAEAPESMPSHEATPPAPEASSIERAAAHHALPGTTEPTNAPRPARFSERNPKTMSDDDVFDLDAWLAEPQGSGSEAEEAQPPAPAPEAHPDEPLPEPMRGTDAAGEASEHEAAFVGEVESASVAAAAADTEVNSVDAVDDGADRPDITVFDDDADVDGYAFMRDPQSRRTGVQGARPGANNSLRARLLQEAEAEPEPTPKRPASGSLLARFAKWLRR